jgi:hypothetical protein
MREQPRHGHRVIADEHLAVVDAPLRVGLEPGRVEPRVAFGVPADEHPAVGVEIQGGRQQRRTVEQQRSHPRVRRADHRDRVRRAEVDAEHAHVRHPTFAVARSASAVKPAVTRRCAKLTIVACILAA